MPQTGRGPSKTSPSYLVPIESVPRPISRIAGVWPDHFYFSSFNATKRRTRIGQLPAYHLQLNN